VKRKASLTQALEHIEDALMAEGYDNILAQTRRGTFHWITPVRARQLGNDGRFEACKLAPDEHYQRIEKGLLKARYDDFPDRDRPGLLSLDDGGTHG
jgi:hypothetical protein